MKASTLVRAFVLFALVLTSALAADVNGKWLAEFETPDGQTRQNTFTFEANGETLTGTVATTRGETKIEEGKIVGDEISFSVTRNFGGNDIKFLYKGKVAGDQIQFNITVGDGERTFDMTAKRVK